MEIRICPGCEKSFYAVVGVNLLVCPHCRYVLYDRRREPRSSLSAGLSLVLDGKEYPGKVTNFSKRGLHLEYVGDELDVDSVIDLHIKELELKCKVKAVWTKKLGEGRSSSGFVAVPVQDTKTKR